VRVIVPSCPLVLRALMPTGPDAAGTSCSSYVRLTEHV
jgi:hypothetical protein